MKGHYLGEFEELILLTVASMRQDTYAVVVKHEFETATERTVNISAVHSALYRLEDKGFLTSEFQGASQKRGGKKKRCFFISQAGIDVLKKNKEVRVHLWETIPQLSFAALR